MSYSRWSNSRWYTYWEISDSIHRDNQSFNIDCCMHFSYSELKDNIDKCLEEVKNYIEERDLEGDSVPTDLELEELGIYMKRFMKDVENDEDLK
ncbi:MAG: hypothetical protein ACOC56_04915 [Atribacterota bacterium]